MRNRSEIYTEAVVEGIKLGIGGVTEVLDGMIFAGVETMDLVELRSLVEQMRMRTALGMDITAIAAESVRRAQRDEMGS